MVCLHSKNLSDNQTQRLVSFLTMLLSVSLQKHMEKNTEMTKTSYLEGKDGNRLQTDATNKHF